MKFGPVTNGASNDYKISSLNLLKCLICCYCHQKIFSENQSALLTLLIFYLFGVYLHPITSNIISAFHLCLNYNIMCKSTYNLQRSCIFISNMFPVQCMVMQSVTPILLYTESRHFNSLITKIMTSVSHYTSLIGLNVSI